MWLRGDNGESPPGMWDEDDDSRSDSKAKQISDFGGSMISGSANDMHCENHLLFLQDCEECLRLVSFIPDVMLGCKQTSTVEQLAAYF